MAVVFLAIMAFIVMPPILMLVYASSRTDALVNAGAEFSLAAWP